MKKYTLELWRANYSMLTEIKVITSLAKRLFVKIQKSSLILSVSLIVLPLLQPIAFPAWFLGCLWLDPLFLKVYGESVTQLHPPALGHISLDLKGLPWPRAYLSQTGWWELPELPSSR